MADKKRKKRSGAEHSKQENRALLLVNWISEKIIDGVPPLSSAQALATEYILDKETYKNDQERVAALIRWESGKNFTSGFLTGLGGFITLPLAIPSAVAASWIVQARMVAAIAHIYGHDIKDEKVKTLVLLSLVGNSANDVLKSVGIAVNDNLTVLEIMKMSGNVLVNIQKAVGIFLLKLVAKRSVTHLLKAIPLMGGVVTGGVDAYTCKKIGVVAQETFKVKKTKKKAAKKTTKKASKKRKAAKKPPKAIKAKPAKKAKAKSKKKTIKK